MKTSFFVLAALVTAFGIASINGCAAPSDDGEIANGSASPGANADDDDDDDDSTEEELASSAAAVKQGGCSMKEIRANQAYCRRVCGPKGSRGVKECHIESDNTGRHAIVNCACRK
jgi:hypothetical protein